MQYYWASLIPIKNLFTLTIAKPLALTGAALLLYALFSKGSQLGQLVFYPGKVRDIQMWPEITMQLELIIQNTNSDSLQINSIAGALYSNESGTSTLIGNVSSFVPVRINGNTQGMILVAVRLKAISLVNEIIRAFQQNNFSKEIELDASANVDNLQLPVNLTFKVGL